MSRMNSIVKDRFAALSAAGLTLGIRLVAAATLLLLAMVGPTVHATPIFSDSFETYSSTNMSPWLVLGNSSAIPTIAAEGQSPFGGVGDAKGVRFDDNSATTNPLLAQAFALPSVESNKYLVISFDFMTLSTNSNPNLRLYNTTTVTAGINLHLAGNDGKPQNRNASAFADIGTATVSTGTWYRFTLTVAPASSVTDSYDLNIVSFDGFYNTTATGLALQNEMTDFHGISFGLNTAVSVATGDFFVDNVSIATSVIPEPATLGLGLAGLLALLGGRAAVRRRVRP